MNSNFTFIAPGDLDPTYFIIDPATSKVRLSVNAFIAAETVSGDTPVMFVDGESVKPADPSTQAYIYAGLALNGAPAGQLVYTRTIGVWRASQWNWGPDIPVFVGAKGTLTQTPPSTGWSHCIGRAIDATTLQLLPDALIYIGA